MEIHFREFAPGDEEPFRLLNEEWIRTFFTLEPRDLEVLSDPVRHILQPGGAICIAEANSKVLGCCALLHMGAGAFEVGKMAVSPELRGRGIGRGLLSYVVANARARGATRLALETNSKLQNAVHLYESLGFQVIPPDPDHPSPYSRSDVTMELVL